MDYISTDYSCFSDPTMSGCDCYCVIVDGEIVSPWLVCGSMALSRWAHHFYKDRGAIGASTGPISLDRRYLCAWSDGSKLISPWLRCDYLRAAFWLFSHRPDDVYSAIFLIKIF